MDKGAVKRLLFCHRPVTGRLKDGILAQNLVGSANGAAEIWMQILFKVAQFWMSFNGRQIE